ncbi:MAG: bis(5'-nucleosyl)-tetraphosphatase (symmetrical) YqeK [Clostridia bacterium]|nr:bis(5'-nucleosyl)-tetraphosphatase (symmetrical) YqeK [Clostridia bacterium]
MTIEEMKRKLESTLKPKRFVHSLSVMKVSGELADRYGVDEEKAAVAGLLHDCAKEFRRDEILPFCDKYQISVDNIIKVQPDLLHGLIGAITAKEEYGITDEAIFRAIRYHTTGCDNMGLLEKIVYLADYIEPGRNFPGIEEVRQAAFSDIDCAMIMALDRTIKYILAKGRLIHPDTIAARNSIIYSKSCC